MGKFEIFLSEYNLMEIYEHFRDYYLQQNAISDGFGYREFSKVRCNYMLSEEQRSSVAELIEKIRNSPFVNYIEPEGMTEGFFKVVMGYVKGYMDFIDAAHLRTAIDTKCAYFITNDHELRVRAQQLLSSHTIAEEIKLCGTTAFLKIISPKGSTEWKNTKT